MEKTALQQVIINIQHEMDIWQNETPSPVRGALLRCKQIAIEALSLEREQIEKAYNNGSILVIEELLGSPAIIDEKDAQDYFTQTYSNNT